MHEKYRCLNSSSQRRIKRKFMLKRLLSAFAVILIIFIAAPHPTQAQDVLVKPNNNVSAQEPVSNLADTAAQTPPSNNAVSSLLFMPSGMVTAGQKRKMVKPTPPDPSVASLPMFQQQIEMREVEQKEIIESRKAPIQPRPVNGLELTLYPDGTTTEQEDQDMADAIVRFETRLARSSALKYPESYKDLIDYTKKHPNSTWGASIKANLVLKEQREKEMSKPKASTR